MAKYSILKEELKKLAQKIKENNILLKEEQRSCNQNAGRLMSDISYASRKFRHMHLAYCLLRGTPYKAIEPKIRFQNVLSPNLVCDHMVQADPEKGLERYNQVKGDIISAIKEAYHAEAIRTNAV